MMPCLESITFDTSSFQFDGDHEQLRIWRTSVGDLLGLYCFAIPPDIDANLQSIVTVRRFYGSLVTAAPSAIGGGPLHEDGSFSPDGFDGNLFEALEYDSQFPITLSRLCSLLAQLEHSFRVAKEVQDSPPFALRE
jgi:hypothetical protein